MSRPYLDCGLAIEEIPGAEMIGQLRSGLSDIPVNKLPFDLAFSFLAGDVFARFDIAYSGVEGPEDPPFNMPCPVVRKTRSFDPSNAPRSD
ncbi:hypothetical protein [Acaryochloris sp. CCMEE 5410]|uniref:hypothetical protein n=1 Tax=Acaryochloris sp. CCMEE 5410 TaxID=310037 RepID=UPI0021D27AA5|nr:hypothetical protein [Acaryochloris sp. CCMEE 5410]